MSDIIGKPIVLSLNASWQALGWITVEAAMNRMNGGTWGRSKPAKAIPIDRNPDGTFTIGNPLEWEDWIKLPVRDYDLTITTVKGTIRCPLVVVRPHYAKIHLKKPKLTTSAIMERDGYTCQYTGKKLPREQLNVDHHIPRDRGGLSTWGNMVACDKFLNFKKGNRLAKDIGLMLIRQPKEPMDMPVSFFIREPRLPEHEPFIHK